MQSCIDVADLVLKIFKVVKYFPRYFLLETPGVNRLQGRVVSRLFKKFPLNN